MAASAWWVWALVYAGSMDESALPDEPPPRTWAQVGTRYQTECPTPLFNLEQAERVTVAGTVYEITGSTMTRQAGAWTGPLRLGVLGAIKDASVETRGNIKKAALQFKERGVHMVLANGDLSEGEFDLEDVFNMLGEEIATPILVHIGNAEGKGSFTRAYLKAAKLHPQLFNLNWIRHVDLGGVHLFSLPGYYNLKFLHGKAGCHYTTAHVMDLKKLMLEVHKGDTLVLTAHGPPLSFGRDAIDTAFDVGNVGDPDMAALLEDVGVPFGIFGHILESGGRASSDLRLGKPVPLPMKRAVPKLFINAGSASALPWTMLNGKASLGMAAVMTVENHNARVDFLTLRKK